MNGSTMREPGGVSIRNVLAAVEVELRVALREYGPMHSTREGARLIWDELEVLSYYVEGETGQSDAARTAALRVAATACRYVIEFCDWTDATGTLTDERRGRNPEDVSATRGTEQS